MDFVFQFGEFTGSDGSNWFDNFIIIITSFGAAYIGARTALRVYNKSVVDQKTKEDNQRKNLEISKLKYLGFLMTDIFMTSTHLMNNIYQLRKSYLQNRVDLPVFSLYPQNSLSIVTEKINQEEYYHASVNQLKDEGVVEMFLLLNNLARQNEHLVKNYEARVIDIQKILETVPGALDDSKDSIGDFIRKVDADEIKGEFYKNISEKLVEMILSAHKAQLEHEGQSNIIHYSSLDSFVKPAINLLTPYAHLPELKDIVYKAHVADAKFKAVEQKIFEMIDFAEFQTEHFEKTLKRLNEVSKSLRIFYNENKIKVSE